MRACSGGATHSYTKGGWPAKSYVESDYLTVDMSVTYKASEDLSFYARGYNLFNEAYADQPGVNIYGSGDYNYPAQSRRFIIGAEYKF